jgi:hypothetical protein
MVGPDYVRPTVDTPAAWRIEYPKAADVANLRVVEAVRRPGARRTRGHRAAQQPRPAHRGGTGRPVHRRAHGHRLAALSADRLRRRRQPGARQRRGPAAAAAGRQPVLFPVPGVAGRVVADRPVRPGAPPDRGGAGARLCQRAGPARRGADGGVGRGHQLHRAALARSAARDRAGHGAQLRRHAANLRAALQGRPRRQHRGDADPLAAAAGARGDPRLRAGDRDAGEPDLDPARPQSGPDRARQDDRPAGGAGDPGRPARARCCSAGPTSCRPSRTWSRPTPTSARRARSTTRTCRSARRWPARARPSAACSAVRPRRD